MKVSEVCQQHGCRLKTNRYNCYVPRVHFCTWILDHYITPSPRHNLFISSCTYSVVLCFPHGRREEPFQGNRNLRQRTIYIQWNWNQSITVRGLCLFRFREGTLGVGEPLSKKLTLFMAKLCDFQYPIYDLTLRRRANARNVSFRISLRWLTYIVNSVDKTKLSCNTPTDAAPQFL